MSDYVSELDLIELAVRKNLLDVNTVVPAYVNSYNSTKQQANVTVSIARGVGNMVFDPIKLDGVKVAFPRVGNSGFSYKIKKGDHVLLGFCQRDLRKFNRAGRGYGPESNDLFPINSAIILGGYAPDADMFFQQNNATEVVGDKIFIGKPSETGPTLSPQIIATGVPTPATGPSSAKQYGPLNLDLVSLLVALVENLIVAGYGNDTTPASAMIGGLDAVTKGNLEKIAVALKKLKVGG